MCRQILSSMDMPAVKWPLSDKIGFPNIRSGMPPFDIACQRQQLVDIRYCKGAMDGCR